MDRPVRIRLLGEFQLIIDGIDVTPSIAYCKPKLLLALLSLSLDKKQSRAVLAETLWPNCASGARANLRHALCVLRQVMGPMAKAIHATASTLALDHEYVSVDVLALCGIGRYAGLSVVERLAYDTGELLEHLVTPANAGLTAWRMSWQSRLSQEVSQCRQLHITQLCRNGDTRQALDSARQWVHVHPGDEHAHRDLIRMLRDSGRREAAMKAYEHCVAVMGEYYGTGPSAETRALLDLVAAGDGAPSVPPQGGAGARPLAVLAIAIGPAGDGVPGPEVLESVQNERQRLIRMAQTMGRRICLGADGNIAVLFGYPSLNERPAEAAARMACLVQRSSLSSHVSLSMGIHAELACVPPGNGAIPMMLVGQRALRVAYLANAGETLLTDAARSRLSDCFTVRSDDRYGLRVAVLEGRSDGVTVHRMFGRTAEFEILVQRWNSISSGRPHTIYLRGEQGIGKSLLSQVFAEYVRRAGGTVATLCCDQENRQAALHPFHEYFLQRLAPRGNISENEAPTVWFDRALKELACRVGMGSAAAQRIADYFFPSQAGSGPCIPGAPDDLVASLAAVLLRGDAQGLPMLLVLDHAQWADATTTAVFRTLLSQVRNERIMILLCGREMSSPFQVDETVTMPPLRREALLQLVNCRAKDAGLPPKVRRRIVEKARGVPLYAEQMVRQNPAEIEISSTPLIMDLMATRTFSERDDDTDFPPPSATDAFALPFLQPT